MTSKVIAFANQKGGVGKTTCCVNLAASMVAANKKVLLIDLDPQGNATMGSGIDKGAVDYSMNDVLLGEVSVKDAIVADTPGGFALLPSNSDLTVAEVALLKVQHRERVLREAVNEIKFNFDFILIDCPPSLNSLTLNALVAADSIIIPMQCEYYALEGLSGLLSTIEQVQTINKNLKVEGIVRTMYDSRNRLSLDVSAQLMSYFSDKLYDTVIPRNVRLAEAPSHGLPILLYDKGSRGASAYLSLAGEILEQQQQRVDISSDVETESLCLVD